MNNLERIEKFKNEKIAINCETEEEAKAFVKWCYENGMEWSHSDIDETNETYFQYYVNETCYTFDFDGGKCLNYTNKNFYDRNGYEIVKYQDFMKDENKPTNLEAVVSKGLVNVGNGLCVVAHYCKYGISCINKSCSKCEFNGNVDLCVQTLLEEHKEPIKLKQWEYDLIETNDKSRDYKFEDFKTYQYMLGKGHFKGVYDNTMTIQEILDSCVVVE